MLVEGRLSGKRNSRVIWSRCQTEDFACGCWAWMALVKVKGCKAVGRLERRRSAKRSSGRRRGGGGGWVALASQCTKRTRQGEEV